MSCDNATMLPCPKHKQMILTLDANDICKNSIISNTNSPGFSKFYVLPQDTIV